MMAVYKKQKEGSQACSCFSDRQTDTQKDRQTHRKTDRQKDRQTGLLRTYNVVITNSEYPMGV